MQVVVYKVPVNVAGYQLKYEHFENFY